MTNIASNVELSKKQRAHYICVYLGINRYYIYLSFSYNCADYLLFRIYLMYS